MDIPVLGSAPVTSSLVGIGGRYSPGTAAAILGGFAAFCLLSVWFPSLRKRRRSSIEGGRFTMACMALVLAATAVAVLDPQAAPRRPWLVAALVVGLVGTVIGGWLDKRRAAAMSDPSRLHGLKPSLRRASENASDPR